MNLTEFRIGNYAFAKDKVQKIKGILQYGIYFSDGYCPNEKGWINPILLTNDWMIKFGFEKDDTIPFGDFEYQKVSEKCVIGISPEFEFYSGIYSQHIKHVHQLQNLFYSITGEELTIK